MKRAIWLSALAFVLAVAVILAWKIGPELARDGGPGWGNIVILLHAYLENGERKYVESYYGHVQDLLVHPGETVKRGQQIATVGTVNGRYLAHLHFEMREFITPFIGPGYRENTRGWLDGTRFIEQHR